MMPAQAIDLARGHEALRQHEVLDAIEDGDPRFENHTPQEIRDALAADGETHRSFIVKRGRGWGGPDE